MQAGLTKKRLTFRDVFTSDPMLLHLVKVICIFIRLVPSTAQEDLVISLGVCRR
jgi:hypothetical protein